MKKHDYLDTEILDSFLGETDRGAVLITAEWLSNLLMDLLISHMPNRDHRKKGFREIFGGRGELSTFSSRIKIAYALGFINKDTYADLEKIRDIRNDFAHSLEIRNLDDLHIIQILINIRGADEELSRKCLKHDKIDDCQLRYSSEGHGGLKFLKGGTLTRQRFALLKAFMILLREIRAATGRYPMTS
jgi:hypothetical protein